jgi:hypothetical protein
MTVNLSGAWDANIVCATAAQAFKVMTAVRTEAAALLWGVQLRPHTPILVTRHCS